ncbi:hypothetical protein BDQ17DRAFT_1542169 [Cyathus striatus]|nr:hypothetical protein BDQ17DRAFT_1542169 [Cyathus striatus]
MSTPNVNHVIRIGDAIEANTSFIAAKYTIPTTNGLTKLFYETENGLKSVDLLNLTESDIQDLEAACHPATFGVNNEDVLDPSYRKALKMDKAHFVTNFELKQEDIGLDIPGFIANFLLDGYDVGKSIRTEIYKLNVYGKDSFFKTHKDTPRSSTMFASLVIAFPTPHCEGGEVTFTRENNDIDHEVFAVTSGSRVTITYNIYLEPITPAPKSDVTGTPEEVAFEQTITDALKDPEFLPDGALIAIGMQFLYPVEHGKTELKDLVDCLKGSDAMVRRVCTRLGLPVSLKAVYKDINFGSKGVSDFIMDKVADPRDLSAMEGESLLDYSLPGALRLREVKSTGEYITGSHKERGWKLKSARVLWIVRPAQFSEFESPFIAYGTEASIEFAYSYICLMADIPSADSESRIRIRGSS